MVRYLVTGAHGMLGHDVVAALGGREVTALAHADLDITDTFAVTAAVAGHDVIINTAAYTRVDDAETDEDTAFSINALGTRNLAEAASAQHATFVQLSTDYVFDGTATTPYDEDAPVAPTSAYGRSKAAAEQFALEANSDATYVVRTAWLYGRNGGNFAKTMLRLASEQQDVAVVADQFGQPTWTADLAGHLVLLLDSAAPCGIYNLTNSGETSWFGFAQHVFRLAGLDPDRVKPVETAQFPRPAARPAYSVLDHEKWSRAELPAMRPWRDALRVAFDGSVFNEHVLDA
jgi:dTDP-4-dehydrorhamnose reductase